jgi:hypothetical protein
MQLIWKGDATYLERGRDSLYLLVTCVDGLISLELRQASPECQGRQRAQHSFTITIYHWDPDAGNWRALRLLRQVTLLVTGFYNQSAITRPPWSRASPFNHAREGVSNILG